MEGSRKDGEERSLSLTQASKILWRRCTPSHVHIYRDISVIYDSIQDPGRYSKRVQQKQAPMQGLLQPLIVLPMASRKAARGRRRGDAGNLITTTSLITIRHRKESWQNMANARRYWRQ